MTEILILFALIAMALFLILLVLVQRGRGGGLAGALGGMGGQSAFGAKAGDTFTKVTMWTAFLWIVLCIVAVKLLAGKQTGPLDEGPGAYSTNPISETTEGAGEGDGAPEGGTAPDDGTGTSGAAPEE